MNDPVQALFQAGLLQATPYPPTSRYHGIPTNRLRLPDGTQVVYLARRILPPPERFATLSEYAVAQGDRLDRITTSTLGDPEQFWRLCDGNGVIRPDELTETVGRRIRITLPEGVPGPEGF
jgi:hypothetical protein